MNLNQLRLTIENGFLKEQAAKKSQLHHIKAAATMWHHLLSNKNWVYVLHRVTGQKKVDFIDVFTHTI